MSGRFISLEGGEGVGKSTQARLLAEWLRDRGLDVVETREPGGTPLGEAIRELLLDRATDMTPLAEAYLFAAARAEHVERLISPARAAGKWVVSDRFLDSSLAYQGAAGGLGAEIVERLNAPAAASAMPDLTILLRLDPALGAARAAHRDIGSEDNFGARDGAYHAAVAEAFDALAGRCPGRIVTVDASEDIDTVSDRVCEIVCERLL